MARRADRDHLALLERAQQGRLRRRGEVAHLVEEERAPVGGAEEPRLSRTAPENAPFTCPKS